jgi:hypothetical protein
VADPHGTSGECEAALLRRAQEAIGAVERIRARAEVVSGAPVSVREAQMITRCAWCSRYRFGDHWVLLENARAVSDSTR